MKAVCELLPLAEYADPDGLPFSVMEQPKKS